MDLGHNSSTSSSKKRAASTSPTHIDYKRRKPSDAQADPSLHNSSSSSSLNYISNALSTTHIDPNQIPPSSTISPLALLQQIHSNISNVVAQLNAMPKDTSFRPAPLLNQLIGLRNSVLLFNRMLEEKGKSALRSVLFDIIVADLENYPDLECSHGHLLMAIQNVEAQVRVYIATPPQELFAQPITSYTPSTSSSSIPLPPHIDPRQVNSQFEAWYMNHVTESFADDLLALREAEGLEGEIGEDGLKKIEAIKEALKSGMGVYDDELRSMVVNRY